jgi:hypothetical protein
MTRVVVALTEIGNARVGRRGNATMYVGSAGTATAQSVRAVTVQSAEATDHSSISDSASSIVATIRKVCRAKVQYAPSTV